MISMKNSRVLIKKIFFLNRIRRIFCQLISLAMLVAILHLTSISLSAESLNSSQESVAALYKRFAGNAHFSNVVFVAKSGGDFSSIQAAVNSVNGTASQPYLIWVAPGIYNERVTMKPYVDIAGAGEDLTKIVFTGTAVQQIGTVVGASNASLSSLTVENTGISGYFNYATAIYLHSVNTTIRNVTAIASNAYYVYGIIAQESAPHISQVTVNASHGTRCYGITTYGCESNMDEVVVYASGDSDASAVYGVNLETSVGTITNVTSNVSNAPNGGAIYAISIIHSDITMNNVTAIASNATGVIAIYNNHGNSPMTNIIGIATGATYSTQVFGIWQYISYPSMKNVKITASGSSTATVYGMRNSGSGPLMRNVTFDVSGEANTYGIFNEGAPLTLDGTSVTVTSDGAAYGIVSSDASLTITHGTILAKGTTTSYGLYSESSLAEYFVKVDNSYIAGSTSTIRTHPRFTIQVGASQLDGGAISGDGTVKCIGVYDENYTSPGYTTCP